MANLTAIRNALAASITKYTGLRTEGQARDSISPPCAVILPGQPFLNYADTMDGAITINLVVLIIISDAAPVEKTQRALDVMLGVDTNPAVGSSVPEAIEEDQHLGGLIHYIQATTADNYGRVEYSGQTYFGCRVKCVVGTILFDPVQDFVFNKGDMLITEVFSALHRGRSRHFKRSYYFLLDMRSKTFR